MKLDRPTIQQATIELLNEDGLDALSMRTLAKKLDVKAASLYFHIKNKNDLMVLISELVSERVYERLQKIDDADFYVLAHIMREELKRIQDSPRIFEITFPFTPFRSRLIELALSQFRDMGVDESHLTMVGNMGNNFVLSYVSDEQYFARVPDQKMPANLPEQLLSPIDMANPDDAFDYGLDIFMAGVDVKVKQAK
ncbi:TetR family transcriptional regulator [Furfurilactobacillus rossiae]|nr:TetR family transcriptional regulator [Furfurilactobacillus rossiae]QLE62377.1 tetracycline repressor protein [Furfurilactobacillus rossiae]